jgi:hypothetical protein
MANVPADGLQIRVLHKQSHSELRKARMKVRE